MLLAFCCWYHIKLFVGCKIKQHLACTMASPTFVVFFSSSIRFLQRMQNSRYLRLSSRVSAANFAPKRGLFAGPGIDWLWYLPLPSPPLPCPPLPMSKSVRRTQSKILMFPLWPSHFVQDTSKKHIHFMFQGVYCIFSPVTHYSKTSVVFLSTRPLSRLFHHVAKARKDLPEKRGE